MMSMTQFVYEVDATDAEGAIVAAAEKVGVLGAAAIEAGSKTILRMTKQPSPGKTDSMKRNLSKAYRLASSVNYGAPSQGDASESWDVTKVGDVDGDFGSPFCVVVDCGIPSWDVVTYRKVPRTKATARFHLRYVVEVDGTPVGDFDKVSDAKALAKRVMEAPSSVGLRAHPEDVAIRRRPVSDGGSDLATMYQRKVRVSKTRPTKTPEGATVVARHHWFVYGMVPAGSKNATDSLRGIPNERGNAKVIC